MTDFVTKSTAAMTPEPDPTKHVNYTYGMVLAEDDFNQEFAYLAGRDQWLARDLLGYGTVRGLQVVIEDDGANGPRVSVRPGAALSPRGQLICVTPEQCASLNAWMAKQKPADLDAVITNDGTDDRLALFVTLCYHACPVDDQPIPGEPCRTEDQAMAASRWQDDFRLELRLQPPSQAEEDGLRDLVRWLRQIPVDPSSTTKLEEFAGALRTALTVSSSTPPDFVYGKPDPSLRIPQAEAVSFWREALRIWTTELRPRQIGQGLYVAFIRRVIAARAQAGAPTPVADFKVALRAAAHLADPRVTPGDLDDKPTEQLRLPTDAPGQAPYWTASFEVWSEEIMPRWITRGAQCAVAPDEECLRLARLDFPVTVERKVKGNATVVTVDQEQRPFVVHLRMLQEWLLVAMQDATQITLHGDVTGAPDNTVVQGLRGRKVAATAPADKNVLTYSNNTWKPAALPDLAGDVTGAPGTTTVAALHGHTLDAASPADQQVLTYIAADDAWRPATPAAGPGVPNLSGDVTGAPGSTTVQGLRGRKIDPVAPTDQQVLAFQAGSSTWKPVNMSSAPALPALAGDVIGPITASKVVRIQNVPVTAGAVSNGQVLTVVGGGWQAAAPAAASGSFVEHPAKLPPYALVAAGIVQHRGSRTPVYNFLRCTVPGDGDMRITFGDPNNAADPAAYARPNDKFMYIIKVTPVGKTPEQGVVVLFNDFGDKDIMMTVVRNGAVVRQAELRVMEFMIEVSRYEA